MDKKASRGRKKEKCGVARNSDMSGRKASGKETQTAAPINKSDGVCGGTKMAEASKACLTGSPHLDAGKREGLDGPASVAPSEAPEGTGQSKTTSEIHQSEPSGHHSDEVTHRNTDTESINPTEDGESLEQLTPEQQRLLFEKKELEQLLEQTKRLQQLAEVCLHRKDENSVESENQGSACKKSELSESSKEQSPGKKESLNKPTATVVPHERKAPLSAQAEPDELLSNDDTKFSVLSENVPFSLPDNIQLLEENAELHHKKVELGVLLQTAKVLLEKTELPELDHNDEEASSFADNTCDVSFNSTDNSGALEGATTNVEGDYEQSENRSSVETLYKKADEITRKAKLFVDMLHEDKDLGSKETQSDLENPKLVLQNSDLASDKTDDLPSKCLVQKENPEEEDKASQAEQKGSLNESAEGDQAVKETDEVDDVQTLDQKHEIERLLQQARQLLEKASRPLWTDLGTEEADKSLLETEELPRTTEKKASEGQMVSNPDQKEHREPQQPFGVTTAENEVPSDVKKEVRLEGIETDKQIQDSGVVQLQPEEATDNTTHDIQPGFSAIDAADRNSWTEVQTALLCEKNELSLLLMKTQLLQQKAEMIMTRNQLTTGKSDLKENIGTSSQKAAELSPQETTEMLHTEELTSEVTKPDLETTNATGIISQKLEQTLDATQQSPEVTKQKVLDTTHLSSETAKPNVETVAEKMKPSLDETELSSETTKEVLDTTLLPSETTKPTSDKISLPPETLSQKTTPENLKTLAENSLKIGAEIPQEKKPIEENLHITECTKFIDDIKHENNDQNRSDLRTEAISREDDPKMTESLSNNGPSKEDTQSDDCEDSESSDEDDPSFDPKEELRLLLQRAKLLIEKSKLPVSERQLSTQSEMCHPPEPIKSSEQEKESNDPEPCTSETSAGKLVELPTEENQGSCPQKQILNSEITNKTDVSLQQTDDVQGETQISQDAELEFLLAKTKLLKLQADELLTQLDVSGPTSDQQLPNSELSNENKVQPKQNADELHNQIKVSETESDQQSANAQLPNEENKVVSGLESCATIPSTHRTEEESKDVEQPKRPTELSLDTPTIEQTIDSSTPVPEKEIQESALPLNEESQLELEEIEESHLEIHEIEKSQFEIEDDYLSDGSELSDMNMYYEDEEYSQDEDKDLPEENEAASSEACLPQSQQQTEPAGEKDKYSEKRELELLLEITRLLIEKATLPLELIEAIPDEDNSTALTDSVPEMAETLVKADHQGEELNLSLCDTISVMETKQTCSQKTGTVTESTAMSLETTGTVTETTEVPSQKTETVTESTAMSSEKTGTVIETTEVPSQKTETVTESTAMSSEKTETVTESTAMSSEKTGTVKETTEVPSQKTETVRESTAMSSEKTGTVTETTEVPSQKTETVTESTAVPSEKTGTVTETTKVPSQKTETVSETTETSTETSKSIQKVTKVLSDTPKTTSETTEMTLEISRPDLKTDELPSEKSHSSITPATAEFLTEKASDSNHLNKAIQPEASHRADTSQENRFKGMTSSELSEKLEQLKTEVNSFLQSEQCNKTENSSMAENSLQNKADEANAENNAMPTTDNHEEAQPDHSTAEAIAKGTSNEQGSQFLAEATGGVPVSHTEAEKAGDLDSKPFKGWTPMTSYTLLLKLQNEMAKMQLQLSNLQGAMRATNNIIQQLMEEAFSEL